MPTGCPIATSVLSFFITSHVTSGLLKRHALRVPEDSALLPSSPLLAPIVSLSLPLWLLWLLTSVQTNEPSNIRTEWYWSKLHFPSLCSPPSLPTYCLSARLDWKWQIHCRWALGLSAALLNSSNTFATQQTPSSISVGKSHKIFEQTKFLFSLQGYRYLHAYSLSYLYLYRLNQLFFSHRSLTKFYNLSPLQGINTQHWYLTTYLKRLRILIRLID